MFCPKCSQPQVSEEVRFCSRCGFPLSGVAELLARGGAHDDDDVATVNRELSPRQIGMRKGFVWMIMSVVLAVIVTIFTILKDDAFVLFVPVTVCFVIGLTRALHAFLLGDARPQQSLSKRRDALNANAANNAALPPAQSIPVPTFRQPGVNTSEMMSPPPSVTERTTKLIDS
ncbi:MAG TPA: zinc ribbon domain-containing protein [Pyrinomonadaceae bacterium]|jgi:hypothetical protein|nr:zinc ribbon domain-containing protein [Pyrinomonadaceae bacterium]